MKADVWLFIGILAFLFIVWVAEGGPSHPISSAGPFVNGFPTGATSTDEVITNASTTDENSETISDADSQVVDLEDSLSQASDFGTPSPYKGLVSLKHDIGSLSNPDANQEYLELAVSNQAPKDGIDVTGWKLEGAAEGHPTAIPGGVAVPELGVVNPVTPITLMAGESAVVSIGISPIGVSFKENECTGYFDQFQSFAPALPHECPADSSSQKDCEEYLQTVPECTAPFTFPDGLSASCEAFAQTNLNYNGCVSLHQGDDGFAGNEWRIYLGQVSPYFTHDHDTIKLLDQNGDTVDLLSY